MASVGRLRCFGCPDSVGSLTAGIGSAGSGLKGVVRVSAMPFMTPLLYLRLCGTPSSSHSLFRRCLDSKFDTCVQEPICNSAAIHFSVILVSARELNCATCAYTTYHQPCVNVWDPFLVPPSEQPAIRN